MKTSEFIKRVEELGYEVDNISFPTVLCIVAGKDVWMASVETNVLNKVDTRYDATNIPSELFDLLVEYVKTPLEDREEEKKYYIRPKGMCLGNNYSMVYWIEDEIWGEEPQVNQSEDYQSTFTLKELEELGINPEHYDLEEVE